MSQINDATTDMNEASSGSDMKNTSTSSNESSRNPLIPNNDSPGIAEVADFEAKPCDITEENTRVLLSRKKKLSRPSRMQVLSDPSLLTTPKVEKSPKRSSSSDTKLLRAVSNLSKTVRTDSPDIGVFLLKQARDLINDDPQRAMKNANRAAKSFEATGNRHSLDLAMCLHVIAAIYCKLGRYADAIPVLDQSIDIPMLKEGGDHAMAKFSGYMLLGDTYALLGQTESSVLCYKRGLEVQITALGDKDPRVGDTCRYLAEAHVQAMQLDEARNWCQLALEIHREQDTPVSLEEIADRRLMALICDTKGDHESALEHLVLASMAMVSLGHDADIAPVDLSIGDTYLSLSRYDEAILAYQKALAAFRTTKGENHPTVASVYVRLADMYNKIGKFKQSKSYCENALGIYGKPCKGISPVEIACGLVDVSGIYESMNEHRQALKLLERALKACGDAPGLRNTVAGIEAQVGAMYYMTGKYNEAYFSFKNAIAKFRASGEKKSAFFGIILNQLGLTCIQKYSFSEAVEMFEEARIVLEEEHGPYHPLTLGVCSNLAGTYDATGRLNEAIEILEYLVVMREEKLGTADPEVDGEKKRLTELLKEAGRARRRRNRSLENLFDANGQLLKPKSRMLAHT